MAKPLTHNPPPRGTPNNTETKPKIDFDLITEDHKESFRKKAEDLLGPVWNEAFHADPEDPNWPILMWEARKSATELLVEAAAASLPSVRPSTGGKEFEVKGVTPQVHQQQRFARALKKREMLAHGGSEQPKQKLLTSFNHLATRLSKEKGIIPPEQADGATNFKSPEWLTWVVETRAALNAVKAQTSNFIHKQHDTFWKKKIARQTPKKNNNKINQMARSLLKDDEERAPLTVVEKTDTQGNTVVTTETHEVLEETRKFFAQEGREIKHQRHQPAHKTAPFDKIAFPISHTPTTRLSYTPSREEFDAQIKKT
jgi:hypothetical protein